MRPVWAAGTLMALALLTPPGAPRWDDPSRFIGNEITGASHSGVHITEALPVITGNTICAEREPLGPHDDASPRLADNVICEVSG